MVPGAPADKKSYIGDRDRQLGLLSCIHCLYDIMLSIPIVMNFYDNASALRRSNIHLKSFTPR